MSDRDQKLAIDEEKKRQSENIHSIGPHDSNFNPFNDASFYPKQTPENPVKMPREVGDIKQVCIPFPARESSLFGVEMLTFLSLVP